MKNSNVSIHSIEYKPMGYLTISVDDNGEIVVGTTKAKNYTLRVYADKNNGEILFVSIDKSGKEPQSGRFPIISSVH